MLHRHSLAFPLEVRKPASYLDVIQTYHVCKLVNRPRRLAQSLEDATAVLTSKRGLAGRYMACNWV